MPGPGNEDHSHFLFPSTTDSGYNRIPKLQVRNRYEDNTPPDYEDSSQAPAAGPSELSSRPSQDQSITSLTPPSTPPASEDGGSFWASPEPRKERKKGALKSFFSLKEPSTAAWGAYVKEQKKMQQMQAPTPVQSWSQRKLPPHVPKVNSKWDGLPPALSKEGRPKHSLESSLGGSTFRGSSAASRGTGSSGSTPKNASTETAHRRRGGSSGSSRSRPRVGDTPESERSTATPDTGRSISDPPPGRVGPAMSIDALDQYSRDNSSDAFDSIALFYQYNQSRSYREKEKPFEKQKEPEPEVTLFEVAKTTPDPAPASLQPVLGSQTRTTSSTSSSTTTPSPDLPITPTEVTPTAPAPKARTGNFDGLFLDFSSQPAELAPPVIPAKSSARSSLDKQPQALAGTSEYAAQPISPTTTQLSPTSRAKSFSRPIPIAKPLTQKPAAKSRVSMPKPAPPQKPLPQPQFAPSTGGIGSISIYRDGQQVAHQPAKATVPSRGSSSGHGSASRYGPPGFSQIPPGGFQRALRPPRKQPGRVVVKDSDLATIPESDTASILNKRADDSSDSGGETEREYPDGTRRSIDTLDPNAEFDNSLFDDIGPSSPDDEYSPAHDDIGWRRSRQRLGLGPLIRRDKARQAIPTAESLGVQAPAPNPRVPPTTNPRPNGFIEKSVLESDTDSDEEEYDDDDSFLNDDSDVDRAPTPTQNGYPNGHSRSASDATDSDSFPPDIGQRQGALPDLRNVGRVNAVAGRR